MIPVALILITVCAVLAVFIIRRKRQLAANNVASVTPPKPIAPETPPLTKTAKKIKALSKARGKKK